MAKKDKKGAKFMRRDKLTVEYDEAARKEYLTGFRKRKDQRRKAAQDKIAQRIKDEKKAEKAEQRKAAKEALTTTETWDLEGGSSSAAGGDAADTAEFADDFSRAAFGAQSVVVTTQLGLLDDDADDSTDRLRQLAGKQKRPAGDQGRPDGLKKKVMASAWAGGNAGGHSKKHGHGKR